MEHAIHNFGPIPQEFDDLRFQKKYEFFPIDENSSMDRFCACNVDNLTESFRLSGCSGDAGVILGDFCRRFVAMFFRCSSRFWPFPVSPKIFEIGKMPIHIRMKVSYL